MSKEKVCTVCEGRKIVRYVGKNTGRETDEACYRCGGDGVEPVMPSGDKPPCPYCTVMGGGHRTACPAK